LRRTFRRKIYEGELRRQHAWIDPNGSATNIVPTFGGEGAFLSMRPMTKGAFNGAGL
jgi:hypothetical protein